MLKQTTMQLNYLKNNEVVDQCFLENRCPSAILQLEMNKP